MIQLYVPIGRSLRFYPAGWTLHVVWMLARFVWWMLRGTLRLSRNAARVWWAGTCTILEWLRDTGERSRADGLRVLAACSYIAALWVASVLVVVHILLAMLP